MFDTECFLEFDEAELVCQTLSKSDFKAANQTTHLFPVLKFSSASSL